MKPPEFFGLLKGAFARFIDQNGTRLGAAIAYYTAFSMAPLLLLVIAIAGLAFGRQAAEGEIVGQISGLVGADSAKLIQDMIQAAQKPAGGILAAVVGVVSLLLGASGVMAEMKDGLNRMWMIESKSGLSGFVATRVKAVAMILAIGFLLLVSLTVSAGLAAVGKFTSGLLPLPEAVFNAVDLAVSFGVVALIFAVLFKVLPDGDIRWRDVAAGSVVTTTLFILGKYALGIYIGRGAVGSAYGAAGSVLIVLAWVYYSAQIFYFGAAYTSVYAERFGSGITPEASAEKRALHAAERRHTVLPGRS